MDHRHINQYRSHPPIQGNNNNSICPICSNSHFPFCHQNPRFPPPPLNQPFIGHAMDVYRGSLPPQRPGFVGGNGFDGGFGGFDWSDDERSRKRVRVGEIGSEEERRLKLVYEHGGVADNGRQVNLMGAGAVQNGGDWAVHQRPHHVVNNMVYPVSKEWNGNGAGQIHHGQNYGSGGVSLNPVLQRFASPPFNMQERYPGISQNTNQMQVQLPPPLPLSPPPPIPMEPPRLFPYELKTAYQSPPSLTFPVHIGGSPAVLNERHPAPPFLHNRIHFPNSAGQLPQTLPNQYGREEKSSMSKQWTSDKPKVIDAVCLFKPPHRATRPDHIVVILRGLPGSGKSYLAKMLRDLEVENGGEAPRIHSMDEYFMTEVEKPEEYENSKSSSSVRGKKTTMNKVMEYCYEPEMEEAYRSSMLKAFKKSLESGGFTFIIVDDRNLRVAHFAQFWATAKRSGYEVYLLEAPYKDPAGCAARNVHNFTQDDIKKMAGEWEEAPSLYLQLDVKTLFNGDNLKETGIEEVDMDMEDEADTDCPDTHGETSDATGSSQIRSSNVDEKQGDDEDVVADQSKDLGRSKWSNDLDDDEVLVKYSGKRKTSGLSDLGKADGKKIKSVHWGDQVKDTGFSIGATKKATQSLVIGPGPGYNWMKNPVLADDAISSAYMSGNKKSVFQERLRAEHESFKDVFSKRKQKLGFVLQDE